MQLIPAAAISAWSHISPGPSRPELAAFTSFGFPANLAIPTIDTSVASLVF